MKNLKNFIKKIFILLCYLVLIISTPLLLISLLDYKKTGDDINMFIFSVFIIPFILSLFFIIRNIKRKKLAAKTSVVTFSPLDFSEIEKCDPNYKPASENNEAEKEETCQETEEKHFDFMDGHEFEYFCASLLEKNGFYNVEVTKGSGDQGIDIIAYKDGIKYGIQCKCYSHDIGNKAVQEAYAGKTFYSCHVAAVLTNRYFTKAAKELSQHNRVLLWDRDKLKEYIQNSLTSE